MENEHQLTTKIDKLSREVEKTNSFWRELGRGVFFGVGSAIGASVIAAIVIAILSKFSSAIKNLF